MRSVAALLSEPGRQWFSRPPATDADIADFQQAAQVDLPARFVELLRCSNGGEGMLAIPPFWLQLFDADFATQLAKSKFYRSNFGGLIFFGSNGGQESIAFDTRGSPPWPIVMVNCTTSIDRAKAIAPSIDEFIEAVGLAGSG